MEGIAQNSTSVAPLGLLFLGVMVVLIWRLPRHGAVVPLLITTCYMPLGQAFVVAGLHFQFLRVLLLVGWCRVLLRKETRNVTLTSLDKVFLWWAAATLVVGTMTQPSMERFTGRAGEVYNALGIYFLIRCWVTDLEDIVRLVRFLAMMSVPLAICMAIEMTTGRNMFAYFGGVPPVTGMRDGRVRCQGAFRHAILAGTYAATLFPLVFSLWFLKDRGSKVLAIVGSICTAIATFAAASSGAMLAILSAGAGFALWSMRKKMRLVRWAAVLALLALAVTMNAPVWYLFSKLSDVFGGGGWHRSYLIDQAVYHFDEWWLVGSARTAHWAPSGLTIEADKNNMDITNQFISEGLEGGLWKLGLFVMLIVVSFKIIGRCRKRLQAAGSSRVRTVWAMGICLFGHCVSFMSVVYFDQIVVMWYWLLASISILAFMPQTSEETGEIPARDAEEASQLRPAEAFQR